MTLNKMIKDHFLKNLVLYIIIILSFTVGVSTGAFTVNVLDYTQIDDLSEYIQEFFYIINMQDVNNVELLKASLFNNIKLIVILWILGMTIIGIPFVLIIIGIKGFVIGFTVGFFIKCLNFKGVIFALLGILPQNLILVPCFIFLGMTSVNFSLTMIKNKTKVKHRKDNFKVQFLSYCVCVLIVIFIMVIGSIIEAYITPVFIKSITASMG
ncbi:stage II sporulation protein M [Petroclostridium sp. X23]|uniref:stage II sporulation protein M n=1 Tax=Petroclostridium sp. X23 TaxID=3045146 RepID=UPI0024AC893F|nr:stage II sporulation protein M [Petroclostridium sp. X23]WHH61586.1 stage II sporulation protein M [Petroclostridium sp. X23]